MAKYFAIYLLQATTGAVQDQLICTNSKRVSVQLGILGFVLNQRASAPLSLRSKFRTGCSLTITGTLFLAWKGADLRQTQGLAWIDNGTVNWGLLCPGTFRPLPKQARRLIRSEGTHNAVGFRGQPLWSEFRTQNPLERPTSLSREQCRQGKHRYTTGTFRPGGWAVSDVSRSPPQVQSPGRDCSSQGTRPHYVCCCHGKEPGRANLRERRRLAAARQPGRVRFRVAATFSAKKSTAVCFAGFQGQQGFRRRFREAVSRFGHRQRQWTSRSSTSEFPRRQLPNTEVEPFKRQSFAACPEPLACWARLVHVSGHISLKIAPTSRVRQREIYGRREAIFCFVKKTSRRTQCLPSCLRRHFDCFRRYPGPVGDASWGRIRRQPGR